MLSRTAASLYWLGRYIERADFTARLVEATVRLDVLSARPAGEAAWASALAVTETDKAFAATGKPIDQKTVARFLTLDTSHPGSIVRCLDMARGNAKAVRTALTREAWTTINRAWMVFELVPGRGRAHRHRGRDVAGDGSDRGRDPRLRGRGPPDDAQPGELVHPAGPGDRARRQHRAAGRREIPSAAAGGPGSRRADRPRPMDHDPADRVGGDRVSLAVQRRADDRERDRPAADAGTNCRAAWRRRRRKWSTCSA